MTGRIDMRTLFAHRKPIIGMVHALPLPGAPRWRGSMDEVVDRGVQDACVLADGGVDGIFIENYGDAPFYPEAAPPSTIASLSIVVREIARVVSLPIGVNVLRNDAASAMSIAHATGAKMIRVNVHTGMMHTDQGPITGRAFETLRMRRSLDAHVAICADVMVKHATPPVGLTYEQSAADTWERGGADALIVSGSGTGAPVDVKSLEAVRSATPDAFIVIGSGFNETNAASMFALADCAIVGSAFERDGVAGNPVESERVARIMEMRNDSFAH